MKKLIIIFTVIAIFLASLLRVAPILVFHYPPMAIYENLILARNLASDGDYKIESGKNVFLASSKIKTEGVKSSLGNKLTPILYGWIYKIFGLNVKIPIYTSILLFAISNVFLFFIVLKLFDYWPAVIFGSLYVFMPTVWLSSLNMGSCEFAFLFFSLALFLYFYGQTDKRDYLKLIFVGLFLSLAVLSRNAFFISALPILVYDFWKNKSYKRILLIGLPILIIVGCFVLNDAARGNLNYYLSKDIGSFTTYGHLFRDPYTYYFDKDSYAEEMRQIKDPDITEFLLKYGYRVELGRRLQMYWSSAVLYPKKLLSGSYFGGYPLILLAVLGAVYLYQKKKDLFNYFVVCWLPFWYITLVVLKTNNWDHFIEISFPVVLMMVLGIYYLIENLRQETTKKILIGGIILLSLFLIFINDIRLIGEAYKSNSLFKNPGLISKIQQADLSDNDIVAVDIHQGVPELLNYYFDKNFVYFDSETIEKLINNGKIMEALDFFGVTKIVGFNEEVSKKILEKTNTKSL